MLLGSQFGGASKLRSLHTIESMLGWEGKGMYLGEANRVVEYLPKTFHHFVLQGDVIFSSSITTQMLLHVRNSC
jgi:hypothetical protein